MAATNSTLNPELLSQAHAQFRAGLKDAALAKWHTRAWENFSREGLPLRQNEAWHYTDLTRLRPEAGVANDVSGFLSKEVARLVNGQLHGSKTADLKDLTNALAEPNLQEKLLPFFDIALSKLATEHGGLAWLSPALSEKGYVYSSKSKDKAEQQIFLTAEKSQAHTPFLNYISVETHQELSLVEWLGGHEQFYNMPITVIDLAPEAVLHFARVHLGGGYGKNLGAVYVRQARGSVFNGHILSGETAFSRETVVCEQYGENAMTSLNGLVLSKNRQHTDMRIVVRHLAPHGQSAQQFSAIATDQGRAIFNGKIYIDAWAQHVNAKQNSRNLLLSKTAEVDAKPELEVYADNVKAAHGAAVGQLDEEQLYYLQSRGISRTAAQQMLLLGFSQHALDLMNPYLRSALADWCDREINQLVKGVEK